MHFANFPVVHFKLFEFNYWKKCTEIHKYQKSYVINGVYSEINDNTGQRIVMNKFFFRLRICRNESVLQIQRLASSHWMDDSTKAVFMEFTLFHPPTGLFTSVILYLEIPDTGGVTPGHSISSTYLYKYTSGTDNFLLFCEVCIGHHYFPGVC